MRQLDFFQDSRPRSFHNTIDLKGKELVKAESISKSQEERVLKLFSDGKPRNAWETYQDLTEQGETMIKDSVKRAITNLMNEGKLFKTDVKTKGEYHISNYQYKLR